MRESNMVKGPLKDMFDSLLSVSFKSSLIVGL